MRAARQTGETMFDPGRPLFLQIAESIADSIVDGSLGEEEKAPSTNELAAFHRINPATAAKGVASLTDEGILYTAGHRDVRRHRRARTSGPSGGRPSPAPSPRSWRRRNGWGSPATTCGTSSSTAPRSAAHATRTPPRSTPDFHSTDAASTVSAHPYDRRHHDRRHRRRPSDQDLQGRHRGRRPDAAGGGELHHRPAGRNGSGKTTTISILTAQDFPTTGTVRVLARIRWRNARVLSRLCFVRESEYPDDFTAGHALRAAAMFFPRWDEAFARTLGGGPATAAHHAHQKLSRGQLSAVGVVIGLASRAEIHVLRRAVPGPGRGRARSLFYDGSCRTTRTIRAPSSCPRTSSMRLPTSSRTILLIDDGRLLLHESRRMRCAAARSPSPAAPRPSAT